MPAAVVAVSLVQEAHPEPEQGAEGMAAIKSTGQTALRTPGVVVGVQEHSGLKRLETAAPVSSSFPLRLES